MSLRRLVLLDGHAILFRAFHAMPPFTAPDGRPTGAVYGFTSIVLRILKELEPTFTAVCFDSPGKTFRDEIYTEYKATRVQTPPDVIAQEPMVKEVLDALAIPHYAASGFEADDLIATAVYETLGHTEVKLDEVVIVTGDWDLLQLSGPKVKIFLMRRTIKEVELLDEEAVSKLVGLTPSKILDWKALKGDPSDNIIGVKGVGDKTAVELLTKYDSIAKIYGELDQLSPKISRALTEGKTRVAQNQILLALRKDAPIKLDYDASTRKNYRKNKAVELLHSFGFKNLPGRLPEEKNEPTQNRLFAL